MIGSDLDGTVREPLPFLGWLRDSCDIRWLRVVGGVLAALTARRINGYVWADFYITGSPPCENWATELWLRAHRMVDGKYRVISDPTRDRYRQKDGEHDCREFKARTINRLELDLFYENDPASAAYLTEHTEAVIKIV